MCLNISLFPSGYPSSNMLEYFLLDFYYYFVLIVLTLCVCVCVIWHLKVLNIHAFQINQSIAFWFLSLFSYLAKLSPSQMYIKYSSIPRKVWVNGNPWKTFNFFLASEFFSQSLQDILPQCLWWKGKGYRHTFNLYLHMHVPYFCNL